MKSKRRFYVVLLMTFLFTLSFASFAAASTHVLNLNSGTYTYYRTVSEDHHSGWGVDLQTKIKAKSSYSGSGSGPIYLYNYYTRETSSYGGNIKSSDTWLVDSYNNKTYTYYTYCHDMTYAQTITMNKKLGWSSSKNPYVTYNLKADYCSGSAYSKVNHVLVNPS